MGERSKQETANIALGLFVFMGANMGIAIGASTDKLGVWLPLGLMLGAVLGLIARNKVLGKAAKDASPDDDGR